MGFKSHITDAIDWIKNNPESLAGLILVGGITRWLITMTKAESAQKLREANRERFIYDPSLGIYWELKHCLTNNQKIIFEERRKNGEPCGQILKELGVLKK